MPQFYFQIFTFLPRIVKRMVSSGPFVASTKIKQDLEVDVYASTIRRHLIKDNLCDRSPRKVSLLNSRLHAH